MIKGVMYFIKERNDFIGVDKALFKRIKNHLGDRYQPSDDELIYLYCETHDFYKRLLKELSKDSLTVQRNRDGKINYIKNPLANELTKTIQILNNLLKSLGLTAQQRNRGALSRTTGGEARVEEISFEDF